MSSSGDAAFPGGGMPRPSADKAFATVQRVRAEIEMLKSLLTSESSDDKQKDATYRRLMSAEQELLHAEGKVDKVKEKLKTAAAAVLPRTQDAPHVGSWARVALKIIRADGRVAAAKMTGGYGSPLKRQRSALGTAPGSPLYFDDIDSLLKRVISSTKVKLVRTGPTEVTVMCEGAFLAGIWFQVSESSNVDGRNYFKLPEARGFKNKKVLEPSAVGVFAVDEKPKQFGSSKHEVFKLLTERGCAAIAHYWTHEQNGALAFQALVVCSSSFPSFCLEDRSVLLIKVLFLTYFRLLYVLFIFRSGFLCIEQYSATEAL